MQPACNAGERGFRVYARDCWSAAAPIGMGKGGNSKHLSPKQVGECDEKPVRTTLLLRAWSLFRASRDGWATARAGRKRHFEEEADINILFVFRMAE